MIALNWKLIFNKTKILKFIMLDIEHNSVYTDLVKHS